MFGGISPTRQYQLVLDGGPNGRVTKDITLPENLVNTQLMVSRWYEKYLDPDEVIMEINPIESIPSVHEDEEPIEDPEYIDEEDWDDDEDDEDW